jgi:hypothetical protein
MDTPNGSYVGKLKFALQTRNLNSFIVKARFYRANVCLNAFVDKYTF